MTNKIGVTQVNKRGKAHEGNGKIQVLSDTLYLSRAAHGYWASKRAQAETNGGAISCIFTYNEMVVLHQPSPWESIVAHTSGPHSVNAVQNDRPATVEVTHPTVGRHLNARLKKRPYI